LLAHLLVDGTSQEAVDARGHVHPQ
jgi:hypothetical protein